MWAIDGAYLKVVGWSYYYLVTVLDDYSRFILAWRPQPDMTAASLIEVVQEAVEVTGMTGVPLRDRTSLLSDNGPCYLSRVFDRYLWLPGIRHIVASPYHLRTNGKAGTLPPHPQGAGQAGRLRVAPTSRVAVALVTLVRHVQVSRKPQGPELCAPTPAAKGDRPAFTGQRFANDHAPLKLVSTSQPQICIAAPPVASAASFRISDSVGCAYTAVASSTGVTSRWLPRDAPSKSSVASCPIR